MHGVLHSIKAILRRELGVVHEATEVHGLPNTSCQLNVLPAAAKTKATCPCMTVSFTQDDVSLSH